MTPAHDLAAKRKRRNEWLKWKIRTQAKQIAALSDKLKTHQSDIQQAIKDYQAMCDETAAKYAEDETETGRQLYWRADGASDAMDALLILVMSPPQENDDYEWDDETGCSFDKSWCSAKATHYDSMEGRLCDHHWKWEQIYKKRKAKAQENDK